MNRQRIRLTLTAVMALIFPLVYYYLSPYLIIAGAAEGVIAGSFLVFAAMFAGSLLLGRVYCGWICPAGATQELCSKINKKGYNGKKRNLIKYAIWAPWLAIIAVTFIQAGGVKSFDPLYQTWNGISIQNMSSVLMFAGIAGGIALFALVAGKRAACHTICWMAPFMVIGRKIRNILKLPALRISANKQMCVNCKACDRNCPMSLKVNDMVQNEEMENSECILCGSCIDGCPKGVLKYNFGKP